MTAGRIGGDTKAHMVEIAVRIRTSDGNEINTTIVRKNLFRNKKN